MASTYMGMNLITEEDFEELDYLFDKFFAGREIWLLGTGNVAESFCRYFLECGVEICGFVVSDSNRNPIKFMEKPVISMKQFKTYYEKEHQNRNIGLVFSLSDKYFSELFPNLMYLEDNLYLPKERYKQYAQEHCGKINGIELSFMLTTFCKGIACYGCGVGSPIARHKYYNLEQFEKDLSMLYALLGDQVYAINFTGGDVFQHPDLASFVEIARKYYPKQTISFCINGLGLDRLPDELWKRLGKCRVEMQWTLYPIDYPDYGEAIKKIKSLSNEGVSFLIVGDSSGDRKTSWRLPLNRKEKNKKYDWLFCRFHKDNHNLLYVNEGTLTVCGVLHQFNVLYEKFGKELGLVCDFGNKEANYLTISKIKSANEIYEFAKKRIPLCDVCAIRKRKSMGQWMVSKGEIEEWTV